MDSVELGKGKGAKQRPGTPSVIRLPADLPMLEAAARAIPGAVLKLDPTLRITACTGGLPSFCGLRADQLVGKSFDRLFAPPEAVLVRERFHHAWNQEPAPDLELSPTILVSSAGSVRLRFEPVLDDGAVTGVVVLLLPRDPEEIQASRDLAQSQIAMAELQEAREQSERRLKRRALELARSNAELRRFAYVASHDMKEPLRMVSMYVQLLRKRYLTKIDGEGQELVQGAVDGITRIYSLIDALLEYSQVGKDRIPDRPVPMHEVVSEALQNLAPAIGESGARVDVGELPTIPGLRPALVRLFQNLVGNSIKFRRDEAPQIRIEARRMSPHWVFSIADNGIGIAPEYTEKVFEIFQRLHAPHEYPGSGIGLAVCRRIVEQHGGRIWFESALGEGTTFFFTLLETHQDVRPSSSLPWAPT